MKPGSHLQLDGEDLLQETQDIVASPLRTHGDLFKLPRSSVQGSKDLLAVWSNFCRCLQVDANGQCQDHEYVVLLEILTSSSSIEPGFTLSYKRHDLPKFLRLSRFPDLFSIVDFGQSKHWRSPLLELSQSSQSSRFTATASDASTSTPIPTASLSIVVTSTFVNEPATTSEVDPISLMLDEPETMVDPYAGQLSYDSPVTTNTYLKAQGTGAWAVLKHHFEIVEEHTKHAAQALADTLAHTQQCLKSANPSEDCPSPLRHLSTHHAQHVMTVAVSSHSPSTSSISTTTSVPSSPKPSNASEAIHIFQIASLIFILISLGAALFCVVYRNPRLRADLAASCEERRNKRLYRHAARRQRLRNCLDRFRGIKVSASFSSNTLDQEANRPPGQPEINNGVDWAAWHEKRLQSREDDFFGRGTMREELWAMRKAHMVVDGIISAEEGRHRNPGRKAAGWGSRITSAAAMAVGVKERTMERRVRSWSDSNGSEKTAPPPYEERESMADLEAAAAGAVGVADGLRYVPMGAGAVGRVSPASSVVDTSPRDSLADSDSEPEKD